MKRVLVSEIKSGDILARPVISGRGVVLLYEGTTLNSDSIQKLVRNEIKEVAISDGDSETTAFAIEAVQQDAMEIVDAAIEKKIQDMDTPEGQFIAKAASKLIEDVVKDPRIASQLIIIKRFRNDIYTHSMGVAAMSVIIGLKMNMTMTQLHDVALGALLHDIGLPGVGLDYIDVEITRLPADERLRYRSHVITGYEKVLNQSWITDMAKQIILLHHERLDGTGYPFHKAGDRIPQEVRLVSICDYFDELANGIGYEKRKVFEVVEILRTMGNTWFDYEILSQVITSVAWYPSGSLVRTNENELGRVIRQNIGLPDRPVLQIVLNADGTEPEGEVIKDLEQCLTLFIEETIDE